MSTLTRHARFCANDHGPDDCCEAAPIDIDGIGAVCVLVDDTGPVIYVEDPTRGLIAEIGKYEIDEAERVALAMLEAVRIAKTDAVSGSVRAIAGSRADS